ncbi:MAG: septum formation initiator family protein [Deltaproteobacteria bacterium]|nr:septum formation initiator family protein [Deltaproteobacteria bacterium]
MPIRRWLFRVALALPLAVIIGYLPYRAYGPVGGGQVGRLEAELTRATKENSALKKENVSMRQEIHQLKTDRRAIERVARDELGLVRPTDLVFVFKSVRR